MGGRELLCTKIPFPPHPHPSKTPILPQNRAGPTLTEK
ncbi:hypothetical protein DWUX_1967 [Desulfovibrio diazotrophicus]|nr:hypothetical protein DWUX_1967 [Desulfovibrio diazotrophicus]